MDLAALYGLATGAILLPAALGKLAAPTKFGTVLANLPLVGGAARSLLEYAIPIGELALALWLLLNASIWAIAAVIALFVVFAIVSYLRLRRDGIHQGIPCGCLGGSIDLRTTKGLIGLNLSVAWSGLMVVTLGDSLQPVEVDPVVGWPLAVTLSGLYWLTNYAFSVLDMMSRSNTRKVLQL